MKKAIMNINEVREYLPHRYPFLMIDKVLEMDTEKGTLTAVKNITSNEPQFNGHFPSEPIMPGVLMVEALAQASALLAYKATGTTPADHLYVLAALDNVRFKRLVIPGDQLILKTELTHSRKSFLKVSVVASVDGEVACSADIMCGIRKIES